MGWFILIMGLCLLVSVFVARIVAVLRLRNPKYRKHDEEIQAEVDEWRDENFGWLRKAKK